MSSSMFNQFGSDKELESNGIYLDYGDYRIKISRAGGANKKFLSYSEAKTKPYRRAIQAGSIPETRVKELLYDIYAKTVIVDWQVSNGEDENGETIWVRGIHTQDGGRMEFNEANVISTFKLLPDLFIDIQQAAESNSLFRKEEMEADAKN